jgi:hypothetical protein
MRILYVHMRTPVSQKTFYVIDGEVEVKSETGSYLAQRILY